MLRGLYLFLNYFLTKIKKGKNTSQNTALAQTAAKPHAQTLNGCGIR